jgi:hypothetical protein
LSLKRIFEFLDNMRQDLIIRLNKEKSSYSSPGTARDIANSLESLSSDIYTDSKRFIYELLQNADDASSASNRLEVLIAFEEDYLIFAHQGEPFSSIDVESICSVGDGNKRNDQQKTGFKGIGFKSVFSHSEEVIIVSNDYSFGFVKNKWDYYWNDAWGPEVSWQSMRAASNKSDQVKMPWQIIPIAFETPSFLHPYMNYSVVSAIRLSELDNFRADLEELLANPQILLFLRSENVHLRLTGEHQLVLSKEKVQYSGNILLRKNGVVESQWLLRSFTVNVEEKLREELQNDNRIPQKMQEVSRTDISFALPLEDGIIVPIAQGESLIFTYLPTSINYGFPFLLNASFLTSASREQIHEDWGWNKWLFEQVPGLYFTWLSELAMSPHQEQLLKLVPKQLTGFNGLERAFNTGRTSAISNIPFLPNLHGGLVKAKEALLDLTGIHEFTGGEALTSYLNETEQKTFTTESLIPALFPLATLRDLGCYLFEIKNLNDFIGSIVFGEGENDDSVWDLILFLFAHRQKQDDQTRENWDEVLANTAFVIDNEGSLQSPKQIYFPGNAVQQELVQAVDIPIMHPALFKKISNLFYLGIKKWLIELGVSEPTNYQFVLKTIIYNLDDCVTLDNALEIGKMVFKVHQDGLLNDWQYDSLKRLKILTKNESLLPAREVYLSNFYGPNLRLEEHFKRDFYVSEKYCNDMSGFFKTAEPEEWKVFFLKIGMSDTIRNSQLPNTARLQEYGVSDIYISEAYSKEQSHPNYVKFSNGAILNLKKLNFLELTNICEFSILFWKEVFKKFLPNNILSAPYIEMGYFNGYCSLEDYNKWAFKNLPIFPTTQGDCRLASDVFLNRNDLKLLAGNDLPVLALDEQPVEEWRNYLGFKESFTYTDYINILKAMVERYQASPKSIPEKELERVSRIYEYLAGAFLDEVKRSSEEVKLLNKDKTAFLPASKLTHVKGVKGFKAQDLVCLDTPIDAVVDLMRAFGVTIIDKVGARISSGTIEVSDLKLRLISLAPLLAIIAKEKTNRSKSWQEEYEALLTRLSEIRFFEASEIWISYGNADDEQPRSAWAEQDKFYYVGNWYSPSVLDGMVEDLAKFLKLGYAARLILVLLLEDYQQGLSYLCEKLGAHVKNHLPDDLPIPVQQASIPRSQSRPYNQNDADLGKRGEQFVFNELKRIYREKYQGVIEDTATGFKIGNDLEVAWCNIAKESMSDHDFQILEQGNVIYLDSKATPWGESQAKLELYLSSNEFALMANAEAYYLARVFRVGFDDMYMRLVRMSVDSEDSFKENSHLF